MNFLILKNPLDIRRINGAKQLLCTYAEDILQELKVKISIYFASLIVKQTHTQVIKARVLP